MPTDLASWASAIAVFLAFLTLASFLGGYFALRKEVRNIDASLAKVTEALPDLVRKTELQKLSADIQNLRIANERLASKGQLEDLVRETRNSAQSSGLAAQQLTGILTIITTTQANVTKTQAEITKTQTEITKTQAEVSELRRDVETLKSKMQGA